MDDYVPDEFKGFFLFVSRKNDFLIFYIRYA